MPILKLKDLIEVLNLLDGELPLYHEDDLGNKRPMDNIQQIFETDRIMLHKEDLSYTASANDPLWGKLPYKFYPAFHAIVFK